MERLAVEVDGWLDLRCPERAIQRMGPLLDSPAARAAGLAFRVRAHVEMAAYREALADLTELRGLQHDSEWVELTEAWCKKRIDDLPGAVQCMERLIERRPRSAIGHFNLGCYLALLGQVDRAVDEVTLACGIDDQFRQLARNEPDLDRLQADVRFRELTRQAGDDEE